MRQIKGIFFVIGCFILWGLLCTLACDEVNYIAFIRLTLFVSIFLLVCPLHNNSIYIAIIVIGTFQAILAILQKCGIACSGNPFFDITGFSKSSGIMGGFQAVALVTALLCLKKTNKFIPLTLVSILLLYSLIISDSRAALLSFACATAFLFRGKISALIKVKKWIILPILLVSSTIIIILYAYRVDSANARLLIWKVTADIIHDNPVYGIGPGRFRAEYMLYQADFFTTDTTSMFSAVADNAAYPYNEYLRIAAEYGIIGLCLFLLFISILFKSATDRDQTCPLLVLLLFSCFSFPSENLLTAVLFPILAGCCCNSNNTIAYKHTIFPTASILFIITTAVTIWFYFDTEKQINELKSNYNENAEYILSQRLPHIYTDIRFNSIYLYLDEKYAKSQEVPDCRYILPTCENWCNLGNRYLENGDIETAEKFFRQASQMIPTRILPKYYLWKALSTQGRNDEANELAHIILTLNVKTENTTTLRIRQEIKNSL